MCTWQQTESSRGDHGSLWYCRTAPHRTGISARFDTHHMIAAAASLGCIAMLHCPAARASTQPCRPRLATAGKQQRSAARWGAAGAERLVAAAPRTGGGGRRSVAARVKPGETPEQALEVSGTGECSLYTKPWGACSSLARHPCLPFRPSCPPRCCPQRRTPELSCACIPSPAHCGLLSAQH